MATAASLRLFSEDDDPTVITDFIPVGPPRDEDGTVRDRRSSDRRGMGIPVHWFHGERRIGDRRDGADRRGLPRIPLAVELEEVVGRYTFYRYTSDIAVTGLSVRHAIPHPRGTTVLLRFTLPDEQEGEIVRCWASVVGVRDTGHGMRYRFIGLSRADARRIARYVKRYEGSALPER